MAYCLCSIKAWPPLCPQRTNINKSSPEIWPQMQDCWLQGSGSSRYPENWGRLHDWMVKWSTNRVELGRTRREVATLPDNDPDKLQPWRMKGRKDQKIQASPELKSTPDVEGNPQGINWHIKHNITSSTGAQSLVLSGELLYYVLLPQFKSQELEANTAQALRAHSAWHRGAVCTEQGLFLYVLSNIPREINVKSSSSQPPSYPRGRLTASELQISGVMRLNFLITNGGASFTYGGYYSIPNL